MQVTFTMAFAVRSASIWRASTAAWKLTGSHLTGSGSREGTEPFCLFFAFGASRVSLEAEELHGAVAVIRPASLFQQLPACPFDDYSHCCE